MSAVPKFSDIADDKWLQKHIDRDAVGETIRDVATAEYKVLNANVIGWIEIYQEGHCDQLLYREFKAYFKNWNSTIFGKLYTPVAKRLKDFLRFRGVCVGNEARETLAEQLGALLASDSNPVWPEDEIEEMRAFGEHFVSIAHNPAFHGIAAPVEKKRGGLPPLTPMPPLPPGPPALNSRPALPSTLPLTTPGTSVVPTWARGSTTADVSKALADLNKIYQQADKFVAKHYEVLENKLRIFFGKCRICCVGEDQYKAAYQIMLTGDASEYYYRELAEHETKLTFDEMIQQTKDRFHTATEQQLYLTEWRKLTLAKIVTQNPDKPALDCLDALIDRLQKVYEALRCNYGHESHDLAGQLYTACQGVQFCAQALIRPKATFNDARAELRNTVKVWMDCNPRTVGQFYGHTDDDGGRYDSTDPCSQYFTDRRYGQDGTNLRRGGRGGYRGNNRGDYRNNTPRNRQAKICFVCEKPGCWSTRHTPEERQRRVRQWRAYQATNGHEDDDDTLGAFILTCEGYDQGDADPVAAFNLWADGSGLGDDLEEDQSAPTPQGFVFHTSSSATQPKPRGRPKGSKNKPKLAVPRPVPIDDALSKINVAFITEKEKADTALAIELRQQSKITTPGAPFELSDQTEIEVLMGNGVFRFERYDRRKHAGRIFKARLVHEIKGKGTNAPYEKSRLVILGFNDEEKKELLTQSPTIQRASQRVILAIAPTLLQLKPTINVWLRDVTQAYTQSETTLQRQIVAEIPPQIQNAFPKDMVMVVVKPLYGLAESGTHWWATYFRHHCDKLQMETSSFDPCLLITKPNAPFFGVVGMQTDDTLALSDQGFAAKEDMELKFKAKPKEYLTARHPLLFNGCKLTLTDGTLLLQQKNQGEKIEMATDPRSYMQQRARGAYIATICQPEASFDLSAAAQHKEPTEAEIEVLNKRLLWQKENTARGFRFVPLGIHRSNGDSGLKLFLFVDASFANNKDLTSQIGYVIALANEKETSDTTFEINGNLIHWSSTKCKRVTRSVLASEIYAMAHGVDMGISIAATVSKILDKAASVNHELNLPALPTIVCTDSRSLYECLVKLGTTKEKRLMIDIMSLRQSYERGEICEVRWIDGRDNPADAMTKSTANRALEELVSHNKVTLRVLGWVERNGRKG